MSVETDSSIVFEPIYQKRVWGGRALAERFGRNLPDDESPYGESWEVSARKEADSPAVAGFGKGSTLGELWSDPDLRSRIFGPDAPDTDRFPLLCKILDARDRLSIQVHPPAEVAEELGGEPKTEIWYIAYAEPGAELYVGVKKGVTPESFREALENGTVAEQVHAIPVQQGEHIFIPSGRLHAIGAGLVIYEIQQNSDTTYRVFDWNRIGMDGKARDLHVEESMKCIDFTDFEPSMDETEGATICECEYFRIEKESIEPGEGLDGVLRGRFAIVTIVSGSVRGPEREFGSGDFFLVCHGSETGLNAGENGAEFLLTTWP